MSMVITVTLNPCVDKTLEVDGLAVGRVNRVKSSLTHAGGKGINVSRVLASFGVPTLACGIAAGRQGDFIRGSLADEGVDFELIRAEGETRTNCKIYDSSRGETTELNEPGFAVSGGTLDELVASVARKLPRTSLLVLSGSLPRSVPEDIYARLISLAHENGVRAFLDADAGQLKAGVEAVPFAVKPNIYELERLVGARLGDEGDIVAAARELAGTGIELVVVSMGAEGAIFVRGGEALRAYPFAVERGSAVGAGDSMVAACSYALLKGLNLPETARLSTAAGAVTASKPGTLLCTLGEALEKAPRVRVKKL